MISNTTVKCILDSSFKKYFENIRFDVIDKKLVKCYQSPYYIHNHFYRFYLNATDIPVFILEYNNYFSEHEYQLRVFMKKVAYPDLILP